QVADYRLASAGIKQRIIRMTIAIEIRDVYQVPAKWKSRAVGSADDHSVVHIGYHVFARAGLVKHIVRVSVAVKIFRRHELPAKRHRRTVSGVNDRQA